MDRLGSCCVDEDASVKHLYMFYYSSKQHFWQSSFVRIWRSDIFYRSILKVLNKQNYSILSFHFIFT